MSSKLLLRFWLFVTIACFGGTSSSFAQDPGGGIPGPTKALSTCSGKFVNPITDICWGCLFPLSIGALDIWPSSRPDTDNPNSPICAGGNPIPRIGISAGFWEPVRLIDVTAKPYCFPNLGGLTLGNGQIKGHGYYAGPTRNAGGRQQSAQWQVHYYVYPLLYWMEILTDFLCFEASSFDIAYITELDPLWDDDVLTTIINPEVALFNNPIAQAACGADCVAATVKLPLDKLFWCAGCNGAMYPMNGNISAHVAPIQSGRLAAERFIYKMHRQGLAWGTMGKKGLCSKYLMPVLKKKQYRLQMVNPIPMVSGKGSCQPIGGNTLLPKAGRLYPVKGEDAGYLLWRKRNCCVL